MCDLSLLGNFGRIMFLLCLLHNLPNVSHMNLRWPALFLFSLNIILLVKAEHNIAITTNQA